MPDALTDSGRTLAAALRRHLLQQFPADRAYDRDALRDDAMPPLVADFLGRTLDRWAEMERERLRSGWFDFEDDAVQEAEETFFDALRPTARVPAEAWEDTLGGAVDLVVRFLATPARALTDAVFEGDAEPLPAATIRGRLPLFAAYPYLPDAAEPALDVSPRESFDPDALFALLRRTDRQEVEGYGPDDWLALLDPLFDLARRVPELDGVPASLLRAFFEAKGEAALAERMDEQEDRALDEDALRKVLKATDSEQQAEGSAQKREEAELAVETEEGPMPLWQRFAREDGGDGSVNARFGETGVDEAASPKRVPLWQRLGPSARPSEPPAVEVPEAEMPDEEPPVLSALDALEERVLGRTSAARRSLFVEQLFRGDAGKYATVLHALDDAASWTEASQIIARDVFRPFRVDIYGEHAVAFTDAVEARFRD